VQPANQKPRQNVGLQTTALKKTPALKVVGLKKSKSRHVDVEGGLRLAYNATRLSSETTPKIVRQGRAGCIWNISIN
jgi:hypothetical protein